MIEFWVYGVVQTPLQTPMQTPLPGMAQTPLPGTAQTPLPGNDSSPLYNIPTGGTPITPNDYVSTNENGGIPDMKVEPGRPHPFMVSLFLAPCLLLDIFLGHTTWSIQFLESDIPHHVVYLMIPLSVVSFSL